MTAIRASASGSPPTNKDSLNFPSTEQVSDMLRAIAFGDLLLGQTIQNKRALDMDARGTSPYTLATLDCLAMGSSVFPPAAAILRATVRAGGVTGELTPVAYGATPATTQIGVAPNGSIVTLGTDAITNLDIVYVPERGLVVEYTGPVASGVLTPPASIIGAGIVLLLEAEGLAGTITGKKIILVPGTSPATLQARLAVNKATVNFNSGTDALTRARVKFLIAQPTTEDLTSFAAASSLFV